VLPNLISMQEPVTVPAAPWKVIVGSWLIALPGQL
jgi:hypothetical protein